jgi:hypothetical protein
MVLLALVVVWSVRNHWPAPRKPIDAMADTGVVHAVPDDSEVCDNTTICYTRI